MAPHPLVLSARVVGALVLIGAGVLKLAGNHTDVVIFELLRVEPWGRILAGLVELTAGALLLTRWFRRGGLLGLAAMSGALLAHATVLGVEVQGDGGTHVVLLVLVTLCCATAWRAAPR